MIHVHQCFNSVGHGTFFNGLAFDNQHRNSFSWIYDCGSKRTKRIDQEIACLEGWYEWPEEVDLLVLSHFDDDHVNGVERLLKSTRVRTLALPYMDVGQSLACAASIGSDSSSASTATFQLDPVAWLQSRGLASQVDTVLMMQGGPRGDEDPPVDTQPTSFPGGPDANQVIQDEQEYARDLTSPPNKKITGRGNKAATTQLLLRKHTVPMVAHGMPLELMFFNSTQPNLFRKDTTGVLVARRSRRPVSDVQADVDIIMRSYRLHDLSRQPRRGWRDALRAVYGKHFGNSSHQRNNISLCLLVRPRAIGIDDCSIFTHRGICHPPYQYHVKDITKAGTLLLGDLRIDRDTIAEMQTHFGSARWTDIGTVQVPHHGSKHSWERGAAAAFASDRFIHCVPDASSDHPHKSVDADLSPVAVLRADYQARVVIDYHFKS